MGANSSTTDPDVDRVFHYNLDFTDRLWRWCAAHGVRLIYASSAATYGDGSGGFDDRQDHAFLTTLRPLNAYGLSKHAFDMRVARWLEEGQAAPPQWAALKFFNVYGPNEYHKGDMMSLVAKMVPAIERGDIVRLFRSHKTGFRDGEQLRDFLYVKDVIAVIDWLRANPGVDGIFNVGSGKARSFLDLPTQPSLPWVSSRRSNMSTCPSICESATSTSLKRRSKNFAALASTGPSPGSKRASKTTSEAISRAVRAMPEPSARTSGRSR